MEIFFTNFNGIVPINELKNIRILYDVTETGNLKVADRYRNMTERFLKGNWQVSEKWLKGDWQVTDIWLIGNWKLSED